MQQCDDSVRAVIPYNVKALYDYGVVTKSAICRWYGEQPIDDDWLSSHHDTRRRMTPVVAWLSDQPDQPTSQQRYNEYPCLLPAASVLYGQLPQMMTATSEPDVFSTSVTSATYGQYTIKYWDPLAGLRRDDDDLASTQTYSTV